MTTSTKCRLPLLSILQIISLFIKTASETNHIIDTTIQCPNKITNRYKRANATQSTANLDWCRSKQARHGVQVGKSFGSLDRDDQIVWDKLDCNQLTIHGRQLACDDSMGFGMIDMWMSEYKRVVDGDSKVYCAPSAMNYMFCSMERVTADFSKVRMSSDRRVLDQGFINTYGTLTPSSNLVRQFSAYSESHMHHVSGRYDHSSCAVVEPGAVFVVSHDDVYNFGHHLDDLMKVWSSSHLARAPFSSAAKLLIFDSFRSAGGTGGTARLMNTDSPDPCGPFCDYYKAWFGPENIIRAVEYGDKKVCFDELYLPPTGRTWIWQDWSLVNDCSTKGPSPLWQTFNLLNRERLHALYGVDAKEGVRGAGVEEVHVVLQVRKALGKAGSGARVISNIDEVSSAIKRAGSSVRLTVADFASMDFREQYLLIQGADILVGMHGAGIVHASSMQVGRRGCCALVEIFPATVAGYSGIHGYGNMARWVGVRYFRYQVADGASSDSLGTIVDISLFEGVIKKAVQTVRRRPSCINGNLTEHLVF